MKSKLSMNIKCLALKYKGVTHSTLEEALKWARDNYRDYILFEASHYDLVRQETNDKYLEKEFLFRGYIPRDSFTKERNYNYIESNRAINGTFYIYPQACCKNYTTKGFGQLPNPYNLQDEIGIMGFTRVDVYYKL